MVNPWFLPSSHTFDGKTSIFCLVNLHGCWFLNDFWGESCRRRSPGCGSGGARVENAMWNMGDENPMYNVYIYTYVLHVWICIYIYSIYTHVTWEYICIYLYIYVWRHIFTYTHTYFLSQVPNAKQYRGSPTHVSPHFKLCAWIIFLGMDLGNDPNGHICRRFSMTLANKFLFQIFFPQQRKPMGSSAQNSSGVHWCRRRVRFNEVPEKVPKVPEKVPGNLGAKPSQVQQGSGESSGEGLGGFGAEPGQVQQGSVPEKVWEASVESQVKFSRVLEKVPEKVWEALVQS